jgi:hypothetical protein
MATNPDDIQLSARERRRLAELADRRGRDWADIVNELLDSAEAVLGIQQGLESAERGEGLPAEDVHRGLRAKYGLKNE